MSFLFDLYQQGQISTATTKAEQAKRSAESMQIELDDLKRKADGLTIACQAMWEIVRTMGGISDEVLLRKMEEIDLRDGRADGKISATLMLCSSCGRKSNSDRKSCLYCGTAMPVGHVFAAQS